jgi:nitrogen-specific signal transduction histidine kinase
MSENPGGSPAQGHGDPELRESQLELMHRTDQLILDHTNTLAETLQFIVSETGRILGALHVDVLFEYPDGLRVEISSDDAEIGRFVPIDSSISGLVLSRRVPLRANDIQADPLLRERYYPRQYMESAGPTPRLSVLVAGLTLDGQTIGVINVEGPPDGRFDESHLNFVTAMARQISVAITHAALFDEDKLRTDTDKLLMADTGVDSDVVMRDVLEQILSALSSLTFLKPDAADILFADPQDALTLAVAYSTNSDDIGIRVPIASSVCGEAFRTGSPILIKPEERDYYRPILEDMRCEMAIPIILGGSHKFPIGVLNLESTRDNAFSNVGRVLAERFSKRVVNAISMTKIRTDFDNALQDQLMVLAADQVLNAVHRINNYIGSIRAVVTDLEEDLGSAGPVDADDIRHRLRLIRDDIEHALEIPDEMRKRIGAPEESVDVNAQVEAGIGAVRIPKNIRLVKDLAPGLPNLPCTALDLVVENLLLNAIKAIRHQPGELRVSTCLDKRPPREPFIVITVQDDGVGMSKQKLDRLFDQRQPGSRGSGLGFGMLWVRGWVRRAQGLIEVESAPGSGTTVSIRFQIEPEMINWTPEGDDSA